MMKSLGHTVYLYGGTQNEAEVDELITCLSEQQRLDGLDGKHFVSASFDNKLPHWQIFNNTAIQEMSNRRERLYLFDRWISTEAYSRCLPKSYVSRVWHWLWWNICKV
jgi:hypothetical protein